MLWVFLLDSTTQKQRRMRTTRGPKMDMAKLSDYLLWSDRGQYNIHLFLLPRCFLLTVAPSFNQEGNIKTLEACFSYRYRNCSTVRCPYRIDLIETPHYPTALHHLYVKKHAEPKCFRRGSLYAPCICIDVTLPSAL